MKRFVGRLGLAVLALGMVYGIPAQAQQASFTDLIGMWEGIPGVDRQSPKDTTGKAPVTHLIVVRSDSSFSEITLNGNQAGCGGGTVQLAGDSSFWKQPGGVAQRKIVFKNENKQFFIYRWNKVDTPDEAYQRADTTKTPKSPISALVSQCANAVRQAAGASAPKAPSTPPPSTPAP